MIVYVLYVFISKTKIFLHGAFEGRLLFCEDWEAQVARDFEFLNIMVDLLCKVSATIDL